MKKDDVKSQKSKKKRDATDGQIEIENTLAGIFTKTIQQISQRRTQRISIVAVKNQNVALGRP